MAVGWHLWDAAAGCVNSFCSRGVKACTCSSPNPPSLGCQGCCTLPPATLGLSCHLQLVATGAMASEGPDKLFPGLVGWLALVVVVDALTSARFLPLCPHPPFSGCKEFAGSAYTFHLVFESCMRQDSSCLWKGEDGIPQEKERRHLLCITPGAQHRCDSRRI